MFSIVLYCVGPGTKMRLRNVSRMLLFLLHTCRPASGLNLLLFVDSFN